MATLNNPTASDSQPWYRQPLVWMIIAIPMSSVLVGMLMLVVSVLTYDGLVADDYYKRGVQINRVLARDERARELGMSASLRMDAGGTRVELESSSRGFSMPPRLSLKFSHSTRAGLDKQLTLNALAAGDYAGPVVTLQPGRWYLELGNDEWRLTDAIPGPIGQRRMVAPP